MKKLLPLNLQMFAENLDDDSEEIKDDNPGNEEEKPEKKYTDDDVNEIVKKKLAKAEREKAKAIEEAEKLAQMNAEEKEKYRVQQIEAELAEYKKREERAGLAKEASNMLKEQEIQAPDEVIDLFVGKDAEATQTAVKAVIGWVEDMQKNWEIKRNTRTTPAKHSNDNADYQNPFSDEHWNLTEQGRLYQEDPNKYEALKALANK